MVGKTVTPTHASIQGAGWRRWVPACAGLAGTSKDVD
jgi:hypothetical protein